MADIIRRRPREWTRSFGWPLRHLLEEFGEPFESRWLEPTHYHETNLVPPMDVTEDEDSLLIRLEVPGMGRDDLDVSVDDGILTMTGEKKCEECREGEDWYHVERRFGRFERRYRLPDCVDAEQVEASYENGVLKLRMPKTEQHKARTIEIK